MQIEKHYIIVTCACNLVCMDACLVLWCSFIQGWKGVLSALDVERGAEAGGRWGHLRLMLGVLRRVNATGTTSDIRCQSCHARLLQYQIFCVLWELLCVFAARVDCCYCACLILYVLRAYALHRVCTHLCKHISQGRAGRMCLPQGCQPRRLVQSVLSGCSSASWLLVNPPKSHRCCMT
jgi:hypothetical protein